MRQCQHCPVQPGDPNISMAPGPHGATTLGLAPTGSAPALPTQQQGFQQGQLQPSWYRTSKVSDSPVLRSLQQNMTWEVSIQAHAYIHTHTYIHVYIATGNYPTTHKRSKLENHATTGSTPRRFWYACLRILRHEGIIFIF